MSETVQISDSLLRLRDIIGDRKSGIPAILPVSKTTWWDGVRSGRYPQPVKLGTRVTTWRRSDIDALIRRTIEENSAGPETAKVGK